MLVLVRAFGHYTSEDLCEKWRVSFKQLEITRKARKILLHLRRLCIDKWRWNRREQQISKEIRRPNCPFRILSHRHCLLFETLCWEWKLNHKFLLILISGWLLTFAFCFVLEVNLLQQEKKVVSARPIVPWDLYYFTIEQRNINFIVVTA
jgi:hypothetical protein